MIVDGTLIPTDRVATDRPFYSGKHKMHGVSLQVIASPGGTTLWVSSQLPGSTHDTLDMASNIVICITEKLSGN